jgi:sec-independent protein translocase protein TatB
MFDIASTELLLIVVVAVIVIGPKDLPRALYKLGQVVGKARGMARHFRTGIDAMVREAELEELQKQWAKQNQEIMDRTNALGSGVGASSSSTDVTVAEVTDSSQVSVDPAVPDQEAVVPVAVRAEQAQAQQDLPLDAPDLKSGSRLT